MNIIIYIYIYDSKKNLNTTHGLKSVKPFYWGLIWNHSKDQPGPPPMDSNKGGIHEACAAAASKAIGAKPPKMQTPTL